MLVISRLEDFPAPSIGFMAHPQNEIRLAAERQLLFCVMPTT